jgi:hypothetical protein
MSVGDWILVSLGFWLIVLPCLAVCVVMLALLWERVSHEPVGNVLLTADERKAERRLIPAEAGAQVVLEAERACGLVGQLEAALALDCAPNPRILRTSQRVEVGLQRRQRLQRGRP